MNIFSTLMDDWGLVEIGETGKVKNAEVLADKAVDDALDGVRRRNRMGLVLEVASGFSVFPLLDRMME
ncbi:MAG: hypothetical protein MZV64_34720 [Ignavibacteriales bacterium]|nr:hypothetical protein [Ignavibacteriales bacterium]